MYGTIHKSVKVTSCLGQLSGHLVVIVGGTSGLGRSLALEAAHQGAEVLVVGDKFLDKGVPGIKFLYADLSDVNENMRVGSELPVSEWVVLSTN
jgi:NAD(P)-dependent dehydrogenase (short-subunit alcohol dehydrogenase family)